MFAGVGDQVILLSPAVPTPSHADAVALVNANPYGNGTAIFTNDGGAARHYQRQVEVGMIGAGAAGVVLAYHGASSGASRCHCAMVRYGSPTFVLSVSTSPPSASSIARTELGSMSTLAAPATSRI